MTSRCSHDAIRPSNKNNSGLSFPQVKKNESNQSTIFVGNPSSSHLHPPLCPPLPLLLLRADLHLRVVLQRAAGLQHHLVHAPVVKVVLEDQGAAALREVQLALKKGKKSICYVAKRLCLKSSQYYLSPAVLCSY